MTQVYHMTGSHDLHQPVILSLSSSGHALLKEQWPEGAQAVTEVTKRPKSAGTRFKESMIALVTNLQTKDPFYVRCIKPNEIKSPMRFDDERCLHQVITLPT